jgi:hypothetical protein
MDTSLCAGPLKTTLWKGTGWPDLSPPRCAGGNALICLTAWIASFQPPSRRTAHIGQHFTSGDWSTKRLGPATPFTSCLTAHPWTGRHISTQYPNPPLRSTTHCGLPRSLWKKTSGVERHGILFSRGGLHPPPYNWPSTTPLPAHMPGVSSPTIPPHPYGALVDSASVTPITSVTDLQGPPSERTQSDKIRDLKSLAKQYARDQGSCDDTRISYLEYVESEAEADWTLARMIAG